MSVEKPTTPTIIENPPSNFASRRAAREAAEAAGEVRPTRVPRTIRVTEGEPSPAVTITRITN